jgi:hypothetical protein
MFVVKNKGLFKTNSDIHSFNTGFNHDLHMPVANLAVFQKGVWYSGIKFITIFHRPSNNYHMIFLNLKRLQKDFFLHTPSTHWRNIIAGNKDLVS